MSHIVKKHRKGLIASTFLISQTLRVDKFTLHAPTREGYTFLGWYTDAVHAENITTINSTVHQDTDVYARWIREDAGTFVPNTPDEGNTTPQLEHQSEVSQLPTTGFRENWIGSSLIVAGVSLIALSYIMRKKKPVIVKSSIVSITMRLSFFTVQKNPSGEKG